MKSYKLSQRQKNIIHFIGDRNREYTTVNLIAEGLEVSSRTIQRDLVGIEEFLYENDFSLIKKPGQGLILDESSQSIAYLYELLEMVDSSKEYEKIDRVNFILSRLLTSKQPIKYYVFTLYLNISERTLIEDLNFIEKWLSFYEIDLLRKRGEGVSIKASEKSIRRAQAKLINDVINDDKKIELLRNIYDDTKVDLIRQNDILSMIDINIINKTKKTLDKIFSKLDISISDNSFLSLLVHISLSIERLKQNKKIDFKEELLTDLKASQDYVFAEKIIRALEKEFAIDIPDIEIYFVAMHIRGTKIFDTNHGQANDTDLVDAFNITKALIIKMESIYGLNLTGDLKLEADLKAHILPALTRLRYKLAIKNPILDEIKEKYLSIYSNLMEVAPDIIRISANLSADTVIPDDEIGYIAIHFITAIESKIGDYIDVNILTVCPTGYGASKLLATNLKNHFSNINIVDNASIMKIDRKYLEENQVDLIVSTIKLDNLMEANEIDKVDYIEMPAIPGQDDYLYLNNRLREISRNKYYGNAGNLLRKKEKLDKKSYQEVDGIEQAKQVFEVNKNLGSLYEDTKFFTITKNDHIYKRVSEVLARDEKEAQLIEEAIIKREKINSTYYDELNFHLLHAKCQVAFPRLGFGREEVSDKLIVVMISDINEKKEIIQFFSEISSRFAEDDGFLKLIKNQDQEGIRAELRTIIYRLISQIIR